MSETIRVEPQKPSQEKNLYQRASHSRRALSNLILRCALHIIRSQAILNKIARLFAQKFPQIGNRLRLFAHMNPPRARQVKRSILRLKSVRSQEKKIFKRQSNQKLNLRQRLQHDVASWSSGSQIDH